MNKNTLSKMIVAADITYTGARELLSEFKRLARGSLYEGAGICSNLNALHRQLLPLLFSTWPHAQGTHAQASPIEPVEEYLSAGYRSSRWVGDKGALRRDLVKHCIIVLENYLSEVDSVC